MNMPDHTASESTALSRRTLVAGAAWSIPAIAVAVAAPLTAASPAPQVNLWSTARLPSGPDGTYRGESFYRGPRLTSFSYTFGNLGPDELPAGATLTIGLPFAAIWETSSFTIVGSDGYPLAASGTGTQEIGTEPLAVRQLWYFTLMAPLAPGASFTVNFTVQMNGTENTATNFYRVRTTSDFQPGSGVTDSDTGNNADFSDNYAYFNHASASNI
ncbi:hypothetical protein [Microbacterium esteraromaticum]|uniref:hypothetical protein n=1 Tax=Microbacterium esteraromaticum TaxID=57043 RepID=UPI00195F0ACD|nr:hypothetical protein [Microbacterium esteraromaticum]MBM7466052.1 hypothetical protein [Microbacterium esteraromaticum]